MELGQLAHDRFVRRGCLCDSIDGAADLQSAVSNHREDAVAAAGTLPPDRATTGSAVLNMSRQVGGAIGVAVLIALTAGGNPINGYDHAWGVQTCMGLLAAGFLLGFHERRAR